MLNDHDTVAEVWNWSRWCWMGDWPHPDPNLKCGSIERGYLREADEEEEDPEPKPIPVNIDRAQRVNRIYETLPLIEQRVIQAEFTRRHEYGEANARERRDMASAIIGIPPAYYQIALGLFKQKVKEEF
ncbi:hypothetical protein ACOTC8_30175 [Achromobacter xylosoxidans]|uniref:hypothetical protein n=1 Tax=Alcaligenes xylosoxydans xylosoxydans TaxID=85698 RepID=UPI0006BF726C|nr:hypothetical protein [Achromobacter xylosoxidans]CUJ41644.1 Uncharacterised protein [Achromobacter xylosoxidans]